MNKINTIVLIIVGSQILSVKNRSAVPLLVCIDQRLLRSLVELCLFVNPHLHSLQDPRYEQDELGLTWPLLKPC